MAGIKTRVRVITRVNAKVLARIEGRVTKDHA
jgi:hypothetical protein